MSEETPHAPATQTPHQRAIRSFVLRAGRMGTGQQRALEELSPRFVLPYAAATLDLDAAFGRHAPHVLEIGFGMGAATAEIAVQHLDTDYLGIEVHTPGVGALLKAISERKLSNIRIIQHDAVEALQHMLADASLDGIHIYFPDPWHKKRHHKRRLIQPTFAHLLASKLKLGGYLHLATDWQDYAEQMLAVLSQERLLANTSQDFAPRPEWRPLTKFEQRGLRLGHGVWDLLLTRR